MLKRSVAAVIAASLFLAACASASTESTESDPTTTTADADGTFTGADGAVSSIEDTSRIVVLNGDITETIFALGAGDRVVGVDLTTTYPPEAAALPDVGLYRDLNAEAIIELSPTLVIGDAQVDSVAAIEQLRAAGIPVVIVPLEVSLEGVPRKFARIGEILGLEEEAAALTESVQAEIDEAKALAAEATSTPRAAYLYARGPETLLLFGNAMPTHFLIEAAGAVDAAGEAGVVFAENLSAERLVTAAPEIIITPTDGVEIMGMGAILGLPGVADTPAGKNGAVLHYDEALLLGMGPRVGEALRQLVLDLHPELDG